MSKGQGTVIVTAQGDGYKVQAQGTFGGGYTKHSSKENVVNEAASALAHELYGQRPVTLIAEQWIRDELKGQGFEFMTREMFQREMNRAKTFQSLGDRPHYWAGYIRGLRRAYHGESFGTQEEHEKWLSLVNDADENRQETGQGYRDGLRA